MLIALLLIAYCLLLILQTSKKFDQFRLFAFRQDKMKISFNTEIFNVNDRRSTLFFSSFKIVLIERNAIHSEMKKIIFDNFHCFPICITVFNSWILISFSLSLFWMNSSVPEPCSLKTRSSW